MYLSDQLLVSSGFGVEAKLERREVEKNAAKALRVVLHPSANQEETNSDGDPGERSSRPFTIAAHWQVDPMYKQYWRSRNKSKRSSQVRADEDEEYDKNEKLHKLPAKASFEVHRHARRRASEHDLTLPASQRVIVSPNWNTRLTYQDSRDFVETVPLLRPSADLQYLKISGAAVSPQVNEHTIATPPTSITRSIIPILISTIFVIITATLLIARVIQSIWIAQRLFRIKRLVEHCERSLQLDQSGERNGKERKDPFMRAMEQSLSE